MRDIFDFFELENEIERMREANILYLVVSKFCDVDLHPNTVPNEQMGLIFENRLMHIEELLDEEVTALAGERYARKAPSVGGRRHGSNLW